MRPGFPGGSEVKSLPANAGYMGSIPGSGRSPGEGNGNPPQYSCLENPMDKGAWPAIVHGVMRVGCKLSTKQQQLVSQVSSKTCEVGGRSGGSLTNSVDWSRGA